MEKRTLGIAAAYAGSAIAHSDPFKTGVTATRIAITAFIIPYVFAFSPELLLVGGSLVDALWIMVTAFIGMLGVSTGMEGYMISRLNPVQRVLCLAGGITLIIPGAITDVIGIALIGSVFIMQKFLQPKVSA